MIALFRGMTQLDPPGGTSFAQYDAFPEGIRLAALRMAKSAGFTEGGVITWAGYTYYIQCLHPVRQWWSVNWFPATVAISTILVGLIVAGTSLWSLLGV